MAEIARPNLFIVGAPKCGTSAMNDYLAAHPDIFMARKEMHFFGSDLKMHHMSRISLEDYLAHFAGWKGERRIGEASVWYLSSETAAQEIHAFEPQARIIIMLRNPVEMVYSLYYQMLYTGDEDIPRFADALAAEADRKLGKRLPETLRHQSGLHYREAAQYTDQVRRYFDVFGREKVHVILFDDFKRDIRAVYRQTLEFLDVDPQFQANFEVINPNKRIRNRRVRDFILNPPRWYVSVLPLGKKLFSKPFRRRFNRSIWRWNTLFTERPPMESALRDRLQEEFLPEIERLGELLNVDLKHWCQQTNN